MFLKHSTPILLALMLAAGTAVAGPPDPILSSAFSNQQTWGDICPKGDGDALAPNQALIAVLIDAAGAPCVGIPAADIEMRSPNLTICAAIHPDGPTDATGTTRWTRPIPAGGCTPTVEVWVAGVLITSANMRLHSWDIAGPGGHDGFVDAGDLSKMASLLGVPALYHPCYDWNESGGPTIDASDLASFAAHLTHHCP